MQLIDVRLIFIPSELFLLSRAMNCFVPFCCTLKTLSQLFNNSGKHNFNGRSKAFVAKGSPPF